MKAVRLGVVGLGVMGENHCRDIQNIEGARLTAVCDLRKEVAMAKGAEFGAEAFTESGEMLASGKIDGVIIATPHFDHTRVALEAFTRGVHVLTEKPVGVHVMDIQKMIDAYQEALRRFPGLLFAAMFQQRTKPAAIKIKELIDSGELGKLIRASWIVTTWYRPQCYFDAGGWRATWAGEGGGVLMNQSPHQLDMYQWFFGLPQRLSGFASLGKYHAIEVEDEVTAYFEHSNGMVGHFITSTGEAPGTNRLEIAAEFGKLVWEENRLTFYRNRQSLLEHLKHSREKFGKPEHWICEIPVAAGEGSHAEVTRNFCDAVRGEAELIAPAAEGKNSIEITNAIILSSAEKRRVELPLDEAAFERLFTDLVAESSAGKE